MKSRAEFQAMLADLRAKKEAREARVRELDEEGRPIYAFRSPYGEILVHPSTRVPGTWQITRFVDGEPVGHTEARTRREALREAAEMHRVDLDELRSE